MVNAMQNKLLAQKDWHWVSTGHNKYRVFYCGHVFDWQLEWFKYHTLGTLTHITSGKTFTDSSRTFCPSITGALSSWYDLMKYGSNPFGII